MPKSQRPEYFVRAIKSFNVLSCWTHVSCGGNSNPQLTDSVSHSTNAEELAFLYYHVAVITSKLLTQCPGTFYHFFMGNQCNVAFVIMFYVSSRRPCKNICGYTEDMSVNLKNLGLC